MSVIDLNDEIEVSKTVCLCKEDVSVKTIIVGFPGIGLIGSISAKYIVRELGMHVSGYIRSPLIPPLAVFLDGILAYPYRIYTKKGLDVAVLIGESPAPVQAYFYLANAVLDWANKVGAEEIICMDGFQDPFSVDKKEIYLVAEPDMKDKIDKYNLQKPETGYIGGLSGAILNESILRSINGFALLCGTADVNLPDPIGAANIIQVLNKIKNINVNTDSLHADGEKIKKTMKEFADRTRMIGETPDNTDNSSFYT